MKYLILFLFLSFAQAFGQSTYSPSGPQGTYTPVQTNNNCDIAPVPNAYTQYKRDGNWVCIGGMIPIDPPNGGCAFDLSLPLGGAGSFTQQGQLSGTAYWTNSTNWLSCRIYADTTDNEAQFDCYSSADVGAASTQFHFCYTIQ